MALQVKLAVSSPHRMEEADVHMLLHSKHASEASSPITITSEDKDFFHLPFNRP